MSTGLLNCYPLASTLWDSGNFRRLYYQVADRGIHESFLDKDGNWQARPGELVEAIANTPLTSTTYVDKNHNQNTISVFYLSQGGKLCEIVNNDRESKSPTWENGDLNSLNITPSPVTQLAAASFNDDDAYTAFLYYQDMNGDLCQVMKQNGEWSKSTVIDIIASSSKGSCSSCSGVNALLGTSLATFYCRSGARLYYQKADLTIAELVMDSPGSWTAGKFLWEKSKAIFPPCAAIGVGINRAQSNFRIYVFAVSQNNKVLQTNTMSSSDPNKWDYKINVAATVNTRSSLAVSSWTAGSDTQNRIYVQPCDIPIGEFASANVGAFSKTPTPIPITPVV